MGNHLHAIPILHLPAEGFDQLGLLTDDLCSRSGVPMEILRPVPHGDHDLLIPLQHSNDGDPLRSLPTPLFDPLRIRLARRTLRRILRFRIQESIQYQGLCFERPDTDTNPNTNT